MGAVFQKKKSKGGLGNKKCSMWTKFWVWQSKNVVCAKIVTSWPATLIPTYPILHLYMVIPHPQKLANLSIDLVLCLSNFMTFELIGIVKCPVYKLSYEKYDIHVDLLLS